MSARENWIGGRWTPSSNNETREIRNPSNTDDIVGEVAWSTPEDIDAAVQAAQQAFRDWKNMPPPSRARVLARAGDILNGRKEEVAQLLSREQGKPIMEARGEVQRAVDLLHYYA